MHGKMGQKLLYFCFSHKEDVVFDPVDVSSFGGETVVFESDLILHCIEQFFLVLSHDGLLCYEKS